jgi:hypothetical protein
MQAKTREVLLWALTAVNAAGAALFPLLLGDGSITLAAGLAALVSGGIFWSPTSKTPVFWDSLRSRLAGMACLLWGSYLLLFRQGLTYWLLDLLFAVIALLLWLGRGRAYFLVPALGIFAVIGIRHAGKDLVIAALDLALVGFVLWRGGRLAAAFTARRGEDPAKKFTPLRAGLMLLAFALLGWYIFRPLLLMVNPSSRHRLLIAMQPEFPITAPENLSPLAAGLRAHVAALAENIGERSAYQPDEQDRARDYIAAQLRGMGYEVELQEYSSIKPSASGRVRPYYNVEARLAPDGPEGGGDWILSSHYDTAPGTPGAEDNASAVAVMLEAARELKAAPGKRGIRFVSWSTEEPPAFTTRDMGSYRYLRLLRERGVRIHALLNMDMVGYFNPKSGSQLFPPLLSMLHPDTGDFVSLAGNLSSLGLLRSVARDWRETSVLPVETVFLPSVASVLFLGDHLNFWYAGEKAVFITDTAYFRFPYYHQFEDNPEKLDYEKMAELTRAVTSVLRAD